MATSFISEHTAEFCLIPQFAAMLSQQYQTVIPFFYWSSREGGIMAKQSMDGQLLKVVALYARRPKIDKVLQPIVQVKFNERLFERAKFLEDNGIPVFAGVPLISSLFDYKLTSPCAWFSFIENGNEELINVTLENNSTDINPNVKQLDTANILNKINDECKTMKWDQANEYFKLKKGFRSRLYNGFGMWGEIYKPVYFVLA